MTLSKYKIYCEQLVKFFSHLTLTVLQLISNISNLVSVYYGVKAKEF